MLQSKIIDTNYTHDLEKNLNEFLKDKKADQIINIYYTSNATDSYRRYSVIVLYYTESNEPQ